MCISNYIRSPIAAAVFNNIAKRRVWILNGFATLPVYPSLRISISKNTLRNHEIEPEKHPEKWNKQIFSKITFWKGTDREDDENRVTSVLWSWRKTRVQLQIHTWTTIWTDLKIITKLLIDHVTHFLIDLSSRKIRSKSGNKCFQIGVG